MVRKQKLWGKLESGRIGEKRGEMTKILFSSDLHGKMSHYTQFFALAKKTKADYCFLGGDLFSMSSNDPKKQVDQFGDILKILKSSLLGKKKEYSKLSSDEQKKVPKVLMIFGNVDFFSGKEALLKLIASNDCDKFVFLGLNEMINFPEFDVLCLSYIPVTPFKLLDSERYDFHGKIKRDKTGKLSYLPKTKAIQLLKKLGNGLNDVKMCYTDDYTIAREIDRVKSVSKRKQGVLLVLAHSPPHKTKNDSEGVSNYGSVDMRKYVEKDQPSVFFCGHLHMVGTVSDKIKNSLILSSGNIPKRKKVDGWLVQMSIDQKSKKTKFKLKKLSEIDKNIT